MSPPNVSPRADQSGKTKDDEEVTGTITVPEVAHDTEENEYVVCLLSPHGRPCLAQLTRPVRHRYLLGCQLQGSRQGPGSQ